MGLRSRFVATTLLALVALGGAGLAVAADRQQAADQRPEASWVADLDALPYIAKLSTDLTSIQPEVASLAQAGRDALGNLQGLNEPNTRTGLASGDGAAASISSEAAALQADYEAAGAHIQRALLGPQTSADMAAIDAAVAAVADVPTSWKTIKTRATLVMQLLDDLTQHDAQVFKATTAGRQSDWADALNDLASAAACVTDARGVSDQLAADGPVDTLNELLDRYDTFDGSLRSLYGYLGSGGTQNGDQFDALQRAVQAAQSLLPADNGALSVIVGDASGTSISDALLKIEQDRGKIDGAVETATTPPPSEAP